MRGKVDKGHVGTAVGAITSARNATSTVAVDSSHFGVDRFEAPTFQDMSSAFNLLEMSLEEAAQLAHEMNARLSPLISFEGHDSNGEVVSTPQGESAMVNRVLSQAAQLQSINLLTRKILQHLTV